VCLLTAAAVSLKSICMPVCCQGGHLDTLRCLREHGCPWDEDQVRRRAARRGSVAILEYIQQQGLLTTTAQLTEMLNIAGVARNNQAAVQWLREQGAQWPETLKYRSARWRRATIAWAREQGCTALAGDEQVRYVTLFHSVTCTAAGHHAC
jgi:hypothetical protein